MADQTLVICYTDLKGSTALTEELGHNALRPYLNQHFSFGRTLTALAGGTYVKGLGDGILATFQSIESAISFALQLQELYMEQPCLKSPLLKLRIGLFLGLAEVTASDVFGSAVNQAAGIQAQAGTGQIFINKLLFDSFNIQWGVQKTRQYFFSAGNHELKGIHNPPTQELFSFEWRQFKNDCPDYSIAKLIFERFGLGKVEVSNLSVKDFSNPETIIWPVVPRDIVNAIHRGQAEVIRLLVILGWRVHLLIADCGALNSYEKADSMAFCEKLKKYIANRNIEQIEASYLSDFYDPHSPDYDRIQEIFRAIISDLTLQDFLNINTKGYVDEIKDEIRRTATLDCLRPILSLAAVLYLAEKAERKSIIVAGADERAQWERAYDIPNALKQIGVLMIPILKADATHQIRLRKAGPIWLSQHALLTAMSSNNIAWWAFHLHAFIPAFPAPFVTISGRNITPQDWSSELEIPETIRKEDLAQKVWEILNPAS